MPTPRPVPISAHHLDAPPLYLAADIRRIERTWATRHPGDSLMDKAGAAIAECAGRLAEDTGDPILILAGPGNNGGDALVAARHLVDQGSRVVVVSRAPATQRPPDAARAWAAWQHRGGTIQTDIPAHAFSLVIDGLYGAGLTRDIAGHDADWITWINALTCPKLAIDLPSGLDSDRGQVRGCALRADHTLTFLGLKPGLLTADGPDYTGTWHLDTLGVDPASLPATPGKALVGLEAHHHLPLRKYNSHKGDYGHVALIGGDRGMVGAGLIAGRAALAHGAGSVTLGLLDERVAVDYGEPRLMFTLAETLLAAAPSVLAIGPGLGQSARAQALLEVALAAVCPLVIDADALNLLASQPALARLASNRAHPTLLTPHPGEAARLLGISVTDIQANRIEAARQLSSTYRASVALKGAGTVIAHPDGRYVINTSGGPWLSQAGSGDRLTGMVAAYLAQGMAPDHALEASVWLHGKETPV